MSIPESSAPQPSPIAGSRWQAALAGDRVVFADLAKDVWYPVFVWLRASGASCEEAASGTESFFSRLIAAEPPHPGEESAGRLQDFLLQRLDAYTASPFPPPVSPEAGTLFVIDREYAEQRFAKEPQRKPRDLFCRRWALDLLEATLDQLRTEYDTSNKAGLFTHLPQFLSFSAGEDRYAETAPRLGIAVGALHLAVFHFRKRYREVLRELVRDTVRDAADVDSELTKLLVGST